MGPELKRPRLLQHFAKSPVYVSSILWSFMYRDVKWYLALVFGIALAATFFHSCQSSPDSASPDSGPPTSQQEP